jgi:hypothetical protein
MTSTNMRWSKIVFDFIPPILCHCTPCCAWLWNMYLRLFLFTLQYQSPLAFTSEPPPEEFVLVSPSTCLMPLTLGLRTARAKPYQSSICFYHGSPSPPIFKTLLAPIFLSVTSLFIHVFILHTCCQLYLTSPLHNYPYHSCTPTPSLSNISVQCNLLRLTQSWGACVHQTS